LDLSRPLGVVLLVGVTIEDVLLPVGVTTKEGVLLTAGETTIDGVDVFGGIIEEVTNGGGTEVGVVGGDTLEGVWKYCIVIGVVA
jgi:hypothetical protein